MDIQYTAWPTLSQFHHSNMRVRGVMGPFGSGKSVAMCMEILYRAMNQRPYKGVRKNRWAIIRNTYAQLRSTTIKTWQDWIPNSVCPIVYDSPIRGKMKQELADGTTLDLEIYFLALDRPDHIDKITSLEITSAWINEARKVPKYIVDGVLGRLGRYPRRQSEGGPSWYGLIMDTNPPDTKHWWYKFAEEETPIGWKFWKQPGGLLKRSANGKTIYLPNPTAENIANLANGYRYYMDQVSGADPHFIQVHLLGEYGALFDGRPVYDGIWSDQIHVAETPLGAIPGIPLHIGWDYGLTPAAVVGQISPNGRLQILREYVCERGGIRQFAQEIVIPALKNEFPMHPIESIVCVGDPAGTQASQVDLTTPQSELQRLGFNISPATEHLGRLAVKFEPRRQSVINFLSRLTDGKPTFQLDKRCENLRKGFNGGYLFSRTRSTSDDTYKEAPDKNSYSHPHDALQYLCLSLDPSIKRTETADTAGDFSTGWKGFM